MAWLFDVPPSPFETKLPSGTPINWNDPLSQGLVLCWPANEGTGSNLLEVASNYPGNRSMMLHWGANTSLGTGADAPTWVTYQKALAVKCPIGTPSGQNLQTIDPVNAITPGVELRPLFSMKNGITLEFWGQIAGDIAFDYGLMTVINAVSNLVLIRISIQSGGANALIRLRPNNIESVFYPNHAAIPNHIVATITSRGDAALYGNGVLLNTGNIATTLTEDANYVQVCTDGNILHAPFAGYFYKASVYNYALGPAAVAALAQNPMRVLLGPVYPGVFASDALQVFQAYQLLEYVDGIVPPSPPAYPPPPDVPPQTTPPGTTGPPPRTPPVTPGFAPGFRIFQKDTEIRVKPWGADDSYNVVRPFGGDSFVRGADI